MSEVTRIIERIEQADECEIMEFDFEPCFELMKEMETALKICKNTFDFFRKVRGCDGQLGEAVSAVDKALSIQQQDNGKG